MSDQVFVKRDDNNEIVAIADKQITDEYVAIAKNDSTVIAFLELHGLVEQDTDPTRALAKSDIEMIRVIEDLIELMIHKQIINFTDLPEITQQKILKRKKIREMLREIT